MPQKLTSFRINKTDKSFIQMKAYDKQCSCGAGLPYYRTTCTVCISKEVRKLIFKHNIKQVMYPIFNPKMIGFIYFKFN